MSNETAQPLIEAAQQNLADALIELQHVEKPAPLATADDLDRAYSLASPDSVLLLANRLVYPAPWLGNKPGVTLKSETFDDRQGIMMTVDEPAPKFLAGVTMTGDDSKQLGLDARHTNMLANILTISGARNVLDRQRVLGDPTNGGHRGIYYSGSAVTLLNLYVNDIFQPAQDTQAFYSDNMGPGGVILDNSYLCAAGQSVMFGGGDPSDISRIPTNIRLTNSVLTKKPEWLEWARVPAPGVPGKHKQQVKCALELKNCIDFLARNCQFEYGGTSMGQGGFLIVLTPRNQGGKAPYSTVKGVQILNCSGRYGAGLVNMLGSDDVNPSGPLSDVLIKDFAFSECDQTKLPDARGRIFQFDRGPANITLDGFIGTGTNLSAAGYFMSKVSGLTLGRMQLPATKYGWKINAGLAGRAALIALMPDAIIDATVV